MLVIPVIATACTVFAQTAPPDDPHPVYPVHAIPFYEVRVNDSFWTPRLETNRTITVWHDFAECDRTGRLSNFDKAAGKAQGEFRGLLFDDSDVYKVIEGAAYTLMTHPDEKLDAYLDDLIARIAAAQQPDGYINTYFTLVKPEAKWTDTRHNHEEYCVGHLIEAGVAHFRATGKRSLLDVAIKAADNVAAVIGPHGKRFVSGHQEIELALVKLWQVTGEQKYLDQAKYFLDERGHYNGRENFGAYAQDHAPVREQTEAVGHSVRAAYMYAAMADLAALTGDTGYTAALDRIWDDVVARKLYITGGIGGIPGHEGFGDAYELPNISAYNETCAAIANALWAQRMFQLHADAKYIDVWELSVYNSVLSGISLSGDRFFYPNPLAADGIRQFNHGTAERCAWFACACCPPNVVRFIPTVPGHVYAFDEHRGEERVYVNLFMNAAATIPLKAGAVEMSQATNYPWEGRATLSVSPETPAEFALRIRIPGWAREKPVPSDLYRYADAEAAKPALRVNGQNAPIELDHGYAVLRREWKPGDTVELDLPMPVRRVLAHHKVEANAGRVAIMRGPLVYCAEGADHGGRVSNLALPDGGDLATENWTDGTLGAVTVVRAIGAAKRFIDEQPEPIVEHTELTLIPYYVWAHRGSGPMAVWLPRTTAMIKPPPPPTLASRSVATASHSWASDSPRAMNDGEEPKTSHDGNVPRLTFWNHRGTSEWAQYDLPEPTTLSAVEVYWFDDTGMGRCRVPASWRVVWRGAEGEEWRPVSSPSAAGVEKDRYNTVTFDPVRASAVRLEIQLQPDYSAGILEWKVR